MPALFRGTSSGGQKAALRKTIVLRDHPSEQDLALFLGGTSAGRHTVVVRHLLAGCGECRRRLAALGWGQERLERLIRFPRTRDRDNEDRRAGSRYDYEHVFAKAEKTLSLFLERGRPVEQPPQALLAELFPTPADEQGEPNANRLAIPQLVRWLIARSQDSRYNDTERMLDWAHLARLAVDACTAEIAGGERKLADLQGQAWRQFGNSLRVCGRLREAEEAMAVAEAHLRKGTGDPSIRALFLNQMASLCIATRDFAKALEVLDEAEEIYLSLGEKHQLAGTLMQQAIARLYSGEPEDAAKLLRKAIPLVDPQEDPYLLLAARHNLLQCLIDLDRPDEALALYHQVRELNRQFTDPLIQLRNTWQEGKLLRELGHLRPAEEKLLQARRGFMERGLAYEVAVVSLDLAEIYAKMGRASEVNQLVAETLPIFRALRVGRDMLAALIQLRQVARQERRAAADQAPS